MDSKSGREFAEHIAGELQGFAIQHLLTRAECFYEAPDGTKWVISTDNDGEAATTDVKEFEL
jgi:hypothetical protein